MKIIRICLIILFIYVIFCGIIFFNQKSLIFFPIKETLFFPTYTNLKEIDIKTEDDITLNAWFLDNKSDKTVIFFHWNWWNIYYNQMRLKIFDELKVNAILFDYRGYWKSEGEIKNEQDLYNDAQSVYNYVLNKGVEPKQIIFWGQSLGAAIAIDTAQNKGIYGVISESTFSSMDDMARKQFYYLPTSFLLNFHFKNNEKIQNINSPILVIHSQNDEMIDFQNWEKLFSLANNEKSFLKTTWSHNEWFLSDYDLYVSSLKQFLKLN